MRNIVRSFWLGVVDGWEQWWDLCYGMTWEIDNGENEAYDRGATVGQFFGRLVHLSFPLIDRN